MRSINPFFQIIIKCLLLSQLIAVGTSHAATAKAKQIINIAYLTQEQAPPPALSNLDSFIKDKGLPGAELGIADNNTTGQFTSQQFILKTFIVPLDGNVIDIYNKNIAGQYSFVVVNLPATQLNQLADLPATKQTVLFDVATIDDELRNGQCRNNVLHLLPSRAMRADALAQYMMKKRWSKWFLVVGPNQEDQLYAGAIKRAAKRFGMKIVAEKTWEHTFDARKTAQSDVAVFTQIDDYDVLVVADEQGLFGEYLDYRTWYSRPVIGTQGLTATAWHKTHEQWGAVQMQNRFKDKVGRWMEEQDYGAYLAARAIGEAATRTKSNELKPVKDYMLSDQFALQGYKGNPLSFRSWDGQLRQPILLSAPRSQVAVAPIEGFLHPKTELDTLGYDQPESQCQWSKQ
ncbi:MAG: ABC transporter substrate-binding protein [Methylococcaceae bacterium]|jgi:ABC transporter substrate binding protein (PQQ-dependent alcohol dehydrogenase system)|nr:ABC transporter substrate-binding protein [Methylococcaceae bacterium]MDZ4158005.1 ABC transporter substrate-binding protein [Methylococcales bacterium]MDP2392796.1 ABC transporter substrate-binding protein [Methylococcaceae bacterium]MDP3020324.1 ABC transporter substrate-binding protein [Methylococcaceae bacterium]MDP3391931.1 ABC transporter substrate-binding protein [Methylococcaceae bacterium]